MERLQRLVEQSMEVVHVRAAAGKQRAHDRQRRIAALHLAALEIHEHRRALRRILRILRQLSQQPANSIAYSHCCYLTAPAEGGGRRAVSERFAAIGSKSLQAFRKP